MRKKTRKRLPIEQEIADTKAKDQAETVSLNISMPRGLYLHALIMMRVENFPTVSSYLACLLRTDKQRNIELRRIDISRMIADELGLTDMDVSDPENRVELGRQLLEMLRAANHKKREKGK